MNINRQETKSGTVSDVAEVRKKEFLELAAALARLRGLQYGDDMTDAIVSSAKKVVAINLPSNLLRAAAILVDYMYGFPPYRASFVPPEWVTARTALPESRRGSLFCEGFQEMEMLAEGDVAVLLVDFPEHGLFAGMAGVVRELPSDDSEQGPCVVEFGEPQESLTIQIEVPTGSLRPPRPGDLLENYRR